MSGCFSGSTVSDDVRDWLSRWMEISKGKFQGWFRCFFIIWSTWVETSVDWLSILTSETDWQGGWRFHRQCLGRVWMIQWIYSQWWRQRLTDKVDGEFQEDVTDWLTQRMLQWVSMQKTVDPLCYTSLYFTIVCCNRLWCSSNCCNLRFFCFFLVCFWVRI